MRPCRVLQLNTSMSPAIPSRYRYAWLGQDEVFNSIASTPPTRLLVVRTHGRCSLRSAAQADMSMQRRAGCNLLPDPGSPVQQQTSCSVRYPSHVMLHLKHALVPAGAQSHV